MSDIYNFQSSSVCFPQLSFIDRHWKLCEQGVFFSNVWGVGVKIRIGPFTWDLRNRFAHKTQLYWRHKSDYKTRYIIGVYVCKCFIHWFFMLLSRLRIEMVYKDIKNKKSTNVNSGNIRGPCLNRNDNLYCIFNSVCLVSSKTVLIVIVIRKSWLRIINILVENGLKELKMQN